MYLCVIGIDFASFYDFDIGLLNCSYSVFFSFYRPSPNFQSQFRK